MTRQKLGSVIAISAMIFLLFVFGYPRRSSGRALAAKPSIRINSTSSSKNNLIYGPSLDSYAYPTELHLASAAGHNVTVVDAVTWSSMTTAQFSAFDAIVFGDPSCQFSDTSPLNAALANKAVWSAAIKGPIYVQGTDPGFHRSQLGAQNIITSGINFAASGPGTGPYVSLSCYLSGFGRERQSIRGTINGQSRLVSFTGVDDS